MDRMDRKTIMNVVIDHSGRWDIDFVEKPRAMNGQGGFTRFDIAVLESTARLHPEAWEALKRAIEMVDKEVDA